MYEFKLEKEYNWDVLSKKYDLRSLYKEQMINELAILMIEEIYKNPEKFIKIEEDYSSQFPKFTATAKIQLSKIDEI